MRVLVKHGIEYKGGLMSEPLTFILFRLWDRGVWLSCLVGSRGRKCCGIGSSRSGIRVTELDVV